MPHKLRCPHNKLRECTQSMFDFDPRIARECPEKCVVKKYISAVTAYNETVDLDPEFSEIVEDRFWDMIGEEESDV